MKNREEKPELSPSSRFNIRFMRRTNILAITMFLGGIIYKLVEWLRS